MANVKRSYVLNQSPFFKLCTKRKLAVLLKIEPRELSQFKATDCLYSEYAIPKKSGGVRLIENPRRKLKIVQSRVARLLNRIEPPEYLFCPVKGRSYVTNAARHRGNRVVRALDIKKYFPSTSRDRVYCFFRQTMHCAPDVANLLANIATYKGHLPTGSPLSPIMAFYAHYDVWQEIHSLTEGNQLDASLYIDDFTISGERISDHLMWCIKRIIHRSGLRYHKEKRYLDQPAEITGVIVRGQELLPPNRQLKKRHRAEKAIRASNSRREKEALANQIKGLQGQLSQIRNQA